MSEVLSYKFIGHSTVDEMLREIMPGRSIRLVQCQAVTPGAHGMSFNAIQVWLCQTDIDGDVHYLCLRAGGFLITPNGKPMHLPEAEQAQAFADELTNALRLYLVHRGRKVVGGMIARPDSLQIFEGTADFVRFDKEEKRILIEGDTIITVEDLARCYGLSGTSHNGGDYIEYSGFGNPFLKEDNKNEFVLIGGNLAGEDYGTASDRKTGQSYSVEEVAKFAGVPEENYDAFIEKHVGGKYGGPDYPMPQDPLEIEEEAEASPGFDKMIRDAKNLPTCAECGKPIQEIEGEWYHATYDDPTALHTHTATPNLAPVVSPEFMQDSAQIAATEEG